MREAATGVVPYSNRARNVALAHTVLDMSYNEADLAKAIASAGNGLKSPTLIRGGSEKKLRREK